MTTAATPTPRAPHPAAGMVGNYAWEAVRRYAQALPAITRGWKRATVSLSFKQGPVETAGYVHPKLPGLAVHKSAGMWTVTHTMSGYRIFALDRKADAQLAATVWGSLYDCTLPAAELTKQPHAAVSASAIQSACQVQRYGGNL